MMKPTDFSYHLSNFLTRYLAGQRNLSTNTIKSYRDTFVLLLEYLKDNDNVSPERITVNNISKEKVEAFLIWLEEDRNNSIPTRNQRLAAIHAFYRYLQMEKPECMFLCQKILSIPLKRAPKPATRYLSEDEMKSLLQLPDTTTMHGRRDLVILATLYDTGARVQELADLSVRDIRLDSPTIVKLTGKGNKTRHVPLMSQTMKLLKLYISEQKLNTPDKLEHPLFFNCCNEKLTRQGIDYILKKYTHMLNITNVSPHVLRHTKAMHLTQANVNPIYIRDLLGHSDLKTTQIYSKSNIEMKRKALEKAQKNIIPDSSKPSWIDDTSLMNFLNSLGKQK